MRLLALEGGNAHAEYIVASSRTLLPASQILLRGATLLDLSRNSNRTSTKEERWQEISRYQLFAPSEMALAAMRVELARHTFLSGQLAE
jgi:hypothetical protein